jgi:hypothetical protein
MHTYEIIAKIMGSKKLEIFYPKKRNKEQAIRSVRRTFNVEKIVKARRFKMKRLKRINPRIKREKLLKEVFDITRVARAY